MGGSGEHVRSIAMKILFFDAGSYTYWDILAAFKEMGHSCKTVYYHFKDRYEDAFFEERMEQYLAEAAYDLVFSVNFFPLAAKVCKQNHVKYISWSYDSPLDERLQNYFHYETNRIYLFDRLEAVEYQNKGFRNVYHLPLAVNTGRLDTLLKKPMPMQKYRSEISFVGQIYDSMLDMLLYPAGDYERGFLQGILQAQLRVYGYYFVEELISEELLESINHSYEAFGQKAATLTRCGFSHAVALEITQRERCEILKRADSRFDTHLYTYTSALEEGMPANYGPLKYYEEMPFVFRNSKLNLNITLKDIRSGIPLRALDIMGSRGVLLSNYQPELAEMFEDGKDVILYESVEDAVEKMDFYLKREDLRERIAKSGYRKVCEHFSYRERLMQMLQ